MRSDHKSHMGSPCQSVLNPSQKSVRMHKDPITGNLQKKNVKDVSKPVARHLILPNHSIQYMAVRGLSLHLGSSESRKTRTI